MALVRYGLRGLGINNYSSHFLSGENHFLLWLMNTKNPKVIFDVGANKGDYASLCKKSGFKGQLFGFEPNPITYQKLKSKASKTDQYFNIGFSDAKGKLKLFYKKGDDSSTHATMYEGAVITNEKEEVVSCDIVLRTIDDFIEEYQVKTIDLLKIDTEGNEYKILLGANRAIEKGIIKTIQFEFGSMNVESRVYFKDFYDLLSPNYKLYRLLPNSFLPIEGYGELLFLELFAFQNFIAIKK